MKSMVQDHNPVQGNSSRWVRVVVLTVALIALVFLVGSGLYISYENVHAFVSTHGKEDYRATLAALTVDVLTLVGLFVSLMYQIGWARLAFIVGLLGTAVANGLVGWEASTYFGLAVALWPLMSMELSYKIALSLVLPLLGDVSRPLQETSSTLENPSKVLSKPSKDLQERLENSGMIIPTPESYLQALLENSQSLPSRKELMEATSCTEWQARKALEAFKSA